MLWMLCKLWHGSVRPPTAVSLTGQLQGLSADPVTITGKTCFERTELEV